jgi:hypothetical protein
MWCMWAEHKQWLSAIESILKHEPLFLLLISLINIVKHANFPCKPMYTPIQINIVMWY